MTKYNAAIIGCGSIHQTHADALKGCKYANLAAVCDIDESRLKSAAEKHNCQGFKDYNDILKDESIDVVHICTPHYLHHVIAIEAMKKGKHVLVEKPIAISVSDAAKMIQTSKETGRRLGVCFQNRYNSTSLRIKQLLKSGEVGKILGIRAFVTWYRNKEYYTESRWRGTWEKEGGGVLINQSIHTLDLIQWFMGEPDSIKAHVDTRLLNEVIEVEDTADVLIKFKNGANAIFYATNCYSANAPIEIEIHCEKAVMKIDDGLMIKYEDGRMEKVEETNKLTGGKAYWGDSHKVLINDFYGSLAENKPFAIDGEQAITAIKLIEAIYKSSKSNEYVSI